MNTIALIDTRDEVPQETLGTVISLHETMLDAFKANGGHSSRSIPL